MQFKVPQFLDIEDKIFGPFTFRQFAYLAGGAGMCFILYKLLGLVFGAIPILALGAFAGALTFYRPNGKPFINMVESSFKYFTGGRLYIWKNKRPQAAKRSRAKNPAEESVIANAAEARLTSSKLRDLAWSLDVLDLSKKENAGR